MRLKIWVWIGACGRGFGYEGVGEGVGEEAGVNISSLHTTVIHPLYPPVKNE